MTPDEQKQQLGATIRRKLQKPSAAVATPLLVRVATVSSRRGVDTSKRDKSLERATTKIQ